MKSTARILILAVLLSSGALLSLAVSSPASAAIIDRIVARINDDIITFYELKEATTPFLLQNGMDPQVLDDPQRRQAIYKEVLEDMVDQHLLLQEADKLDLSVTEEQIDQWLAHTRQQQGLDEEQFREMIQHYGMSYSAYREMIRKNLLKLRITQVRVGSQVSISDEEVEEAYLERFGEAGESVKHIEVRHVLIQPEGPNQAQVEAARERAEEARRLLADGESFDEVARAHSDGPSSDQGGFLGRFARGDLDPDFEDVAFELETGEISEVVRTQFGFHVIEVTDIDFRTDGNVEERKAQLRAQLQQEAVERQLQAYVQNLRARAFVEVNY
jgi:peptidyl-prolyl cis-trans isomerase SurA